MVRNIEFSCAHQFEERVYNVYYKDSGGLMRDNPELHMVCIKCGFSQPKALFELLKDAPDNGGSRKSASRVPNTSGNLKEDYNSSLWEQIREEQVTFITPLEFSWVVNDVNQTITITELPAIVGRDKRYADVIIEDQFVARIHARIDVYRNGKGNAFTITDLDSANGTRIDGEPVSETAVFKSGQTLSFGYVNVSIKTKDK